MKDVLKDDIFYNTKTFSTCEYDDALKKKALAYFKSVECSAVSGLVYDCKIGDYTNEENLWYEKDGFGWSTSDIYHFEKYGAELSTDFYNFITN